MCARAWKRYGGYSCIWLDSIVFYLTEFYFYFRPCRFFFRLPVDSVDTTAVCQNAKSWDLYILIVIQSGWTMMMMVGTRYNKCLKLVSLLTLDYQDTSRYCPAAPHTALLPGSFFSRRLLCYSVGATNMPSSVATCSDDASAGAGHIYKHLKGRHCRRATMPITYNDQTRRQYREILTWYA